MYKVNQWVLASILTICSMIVVTSCSKDDDESTPTEEVDPKVITDKILGKWYAIYDAKGRKIEHRIVDIIIVGQGERC